MSSLANQLQSIASLDASRLTSRTGSPSSKSYLFPPKTAASHDLDSIYSLAQSGYEELVSLDPSFAEYEDELFSERARRVDRMLLNKEDNARLGRILERCLRRLGRWIGVLAGGKCIEWLVRRFRVHEMNSEVLLQVFLPYHSSPNFPRILAILTIPATSPWYAPFAPLAKAPQTIPRSYITTAISPEKEKSLRLLESVVGMIKQGLQEGMVHRAMLGFWTGVMVELLEKGNAGGSNESLVKILVEGFVDLLTTRSGGQDVNAAVYPPLVLLSRKVRLADEPFLAILEALLTPESGANPSQRVLTMLVLLNDRPGWTLGLGKDAPANLARIPRLGDLLVAGLEKYGMEGAIAIVAVVMAERPDLNEAHLNTILESPDLPASLIKQIATRLFITGSSVSAHENSRSTSRALLSNLRERHPIQVDSAFADISQSENIDTTLIQKSTVETAFTDVYGAGTSSRVAGVKRMFEIMNNLVGGDDEVPLDGDAKVAQDRESARDAILARLGDTDQAVLQAIYEANTAQNVLGLDVQYLSAVRPAFIARQPDRDIIEIHLGHILGSIGKVSEGDSRGVFEELLFPCLLSTSSRVTLNENSWQILLEHCQAFEVLKTLETDVGSIDGNGLTDGVMSPALIEAIVKSISDGVSTSRDNEHYVNFLLQHLSATTPSTKHLAHLVLAKTIQNSQHERQADVALKVLQHLEPLRSGRRFTDIDGSDDASRDYLEAILRDLDSKKTTAKGTSALLNSLAKIIKPAGVQITWLAEEKIGTSKNGYKAFAGMLYTWINSEVLPPVLARTLLRSLFTQLGEETLVFLASVWTSSSLSSLRVAALRHALAFVTAHSKNTDFQLAFPSLIIALSDEDKQVRQAGFDLVRKISAKTGPEGDVYALDTFYGVRSSSVQLIKPADLARYLAAIVEASNEIVLDRKRIQGVNASILGIHNGKNRKDTSQRRAVIGALLSHVQAWRSLDARLSILSSLSTIKDVSIFRGVLPLFSALDDGNIEESTWLSGKSGHEQKRYTAALFESVSVHSAKAFVDEDGNGWKFILRCLGSSGSMFGPQLRDLSLQKVIAGIFETLPQAQKVTYISTLVRSLHDISTDEVFTSKSALSKLDLSTSTLIAILQNILEPLEAAPQRKKQKQDEAGQANDTELAIADLTAIIESRSWKGIPGDANLIACLMDILSALLSRRQGLNEGVDYLEQETLGAILALVEKIQDAVEIQKAHVGIEVIIKVIRASTNPRTSQRALLVASELARLIPEAVLHNIMPIFTFMGASDFQRDDAYSFGVVEKTVASIVPVMTRSLKEKATTKLELYTESLAFLSIFTDMEGRLPKHRTLPFFVHLVKSLGPVEYLAPVVMLLLDKAIPKAGKTAGAMDLPHGITSTFDLNTRLEVVYEMVEEAGRLVGDLAQEEQTALLNRGTSDGDRALKQVASLLHFATGVLRQALGKASSQAVVERIVSKTISLGGSVSASTKASTIGVGQTLEAAMQLLSAENFLKIVSTLLDNDRAEDIKMSLDVLVDRLPRIKTDIRVINAKVIAEIIKKSANYLVQSSVSPVITASLSALRAIIVSAQKSEEAAIASVVSQLVGVVGKMSNVFNLEDLLSLLDLTIRRVGSRIIPFISPLTASILPLAASTSNTRQSSHAITAQAFKVFAALIETVPTFIAAKQLSSILHTAIGYREVDPDVAKSVIGVASRKIPTKSLIPVVIELWQTVQTEQEDSMQAFFDLLRQTLKHADRTALPPTMKTLFAFFLQVFDLRHHLQIRGMDQGIINGIEESAIGSFLELVTKMNEVGFKPLWGRLVDWGVIELGEGKGIDDSRSIERKTVLLHVMLGLLSRFKHLLSPYIGTLLPHIQDELLPAFANGQLSDLPLWTLLHQTLSRSFEVDDGAFWTDESLLKIIPLLIAQLPLFPSTQPSPPIQALSALAAASSSEQLLKSLNTSICLSTRSDDAKTRLAGVRALDGVWAAQSEGLLPFVPETVSEFLGELLEDENGDVEVAARRLLGRIEGLTGSLKEYLE